jgi:hypothetical protein
MADTDRQKLERLVKEHKERRLAAERKKLEEIEAERKQRESLDLEDREKTKTLFAWCKETFANRLRLTANGSRVDDVK